MIGAWERGEGCADSMDRALGSKLTDGTRGVQRRGPGRHRRLHTVADLDRISSASSRRHTVAQCTRMQYYHA